LLAQSDVLPLVAANPGPIPSRIETLTEETESAKPSTKPGALQKQEQHAEGEKDYADQRAARKE
jgi:hypothetical protein